MALGCLSLALVISLTCLLTGWPSAGQREGPMHGFSTIGHASLVAVLHWETLLETVLASDVLLPHWPKQFSGRALTQCGSHHMRYDQDKTIPVTVSDWPK